MSTEPSKSPLDFFAELGDLLAKYAINPTYAVAMVIVGWVIWPIGALMASLLIASLYVRAQRVAISAESGAPAPPASSITVRESDWLIIAGLVLVGLGLRQLLKYYSLEVPWSVTLIVVGVLLIGLAFARRGGGAQNV